MLLQSIIGSGCYTDAYALRFNGIDQSASVANPSFHKASAGTILLRVRVPVLLTANGNYPILALVDTTPARTRLFYLGVRRNVGFGDSNNRFDLLVQDEASALRDGSNVVGSVADPTAISASTWYSVAFGSNAKIWLNGVNNTPAYWRPSPYYWGTGTRTGWFNFLTDSATSNHTLFLANYNTNFGQVDINNILYVQRALTSTEHAEYHSGQLIGKDPRTYTFSNDILSGWGFERSLADRRGLNPLTGTNISLANYIAP